MSLRELWPSLTAEQKNVKVAEALGLETRPDLDRCSACGHDWTAHRHGGLCDLCIPAWDSTGADSGCQAFVAPSPSPTGLPWTSRWEHAGPLLDRLREEGWDYELIAAPQGIAANLTYAVEELTRHVSSTWCPAAPEAIAFAFCLAKETKP